MEPTETRDIDPGKARQMRLAFGTLTVVFVALTVYDVVQRAWMDAVGDLSMTLGSAAFLLAHREGAAPEGRSATAMAGMLLILIGVGVRVAQILLGL